MNFKHNIHFEQDFWYINCVDFKFIFPLDISSELEFLKRKKAKLEAEGANNEDLKRIIGENHKLCHIIYFTIIA